MSLSTFNPRPSFEENPKLAKAAHNLRALISAIEQKTIPPSQKNQINEIITGLNDFNGSGPQLIKQIKTAQASILKLLEKDLGLVAKGHYQTQWLAIGMAAFGIPLGVAFSTSLGNMAFLGIGLPIGMAIGIAIGTSKDKDVLSQGKQLDWPVK